MTALFTFVPVLKVLCHKSITGQVLETVICRKTASAEEISIFQTSLRSSCKVNDLVASFFLTTGLYLSSITEG